MKEGKQVIERTNARKNLILKWTEKWKKENKQANADKMKGKEQERENKFTEVSNKKIKI